jgi:hypothetical protein
MGTEFTCQGSADNNEWNDGQVLRPQASQKEFDLREGTQVSKMDIVELNQYIELERVRYETLARENAELQGAFEVQKQKIKELVGEKEEQNTMSFLSN